MKTIGSVIKSMGRSPVKSILTLITVGIGVGVLIIALGMSGTLNDLLESELVQQGVVVSYANGTFNSDGELEALRPPQTDANVLDIIEIEISGVTAASPVAPVNWNEFVVDGDSYRVRAVLGVNEKYTEVMGLDLVAGSFFDESDVAAGERKAVITQSLAEILFGSVEAAIGRLLQPPASESAAQPAGVAGERAQSKAVFSAPTYVVTGVVEDAGELQRQSYGVADMIVPYTSIFPSGFNVEQAARFFTAQGVFLAKGVTFETAEAQLREVLTRAYGDDFVLEVWEGTPAGSSGYLNEMRQTVNTFSLVVNLLGFILLAAASIGILSIMLVDVLGKSREIAIERALGASKAAVFKEFFTRSTIVSIFSVIIGVGLSFVLSRPLTEIVLPVFSGISASDITGIVTLPALLIGATSAIIIGGIFGIFPVFSVLQSGIVDTIKEG